MNKSATGILEVSKIVVIVMICALAIRAFIFQPFIVQGASMEPSYFNRDYLLVERVSYRFSEPERGDTIVLSYPNNPSVKYFKRIIGLPNETIRISDGNVYVNGRILRETYLAAGETTLVRTHPNTPYEVSIGPDRFFVMGDNRDHSSDSRDGWLVGRDHIVGRTFFVLYPKSSFSAVASPQYY